MRRRNILAAVAGGSINRDNYLTFEALSDDFTFSFPSELEYYADDGGGWQTLAANTVSPAAKAGDLISVRAELRLIYASGIGTFTTTGSCNLLGNCMSLLFGDEAEGNLSVNNNSSYAFYELFYQNKSIRNVSKDFLPATKLSILCYCRMFADCTSLITAPELPASKLEDSCYREMFMGCTSLITAPKLHATTMSYRGYYYMFANCTSLTSAPELPATTLNGQCYTSMFQSCTSLTTAPELPATTLVTYCYYYMFNGCTKLSYIKMMATDISANKCLYNWLVNVASSGTFVKNKDATWDVTGVSGVPEGWTVLTE